MPIINIDADPINADWIKHANKERQISNLNGNNLTPIFYSEISSSYMLYDLFSNHNDLTKDIITHFLNIPVDSEIRVQRERNYPGKGSIDIFLDFYSKNRRTAVVIEVKVHDYISATAGQLETYYNAVKEEANFDNIHLIYLTQFNQSNFSKDENVLYPPTMEEYDKSLKVLPKEYLMHLCWGQVHDFLSHYQGKFSEEQRLILNLQRNWILSKNSEDINQNTVNVGERGITEEYFDDLDIDLEFELSFGQIKKKNKRVNLQIDVATCTAEQQNKIIEVIRKLADSKRVNRDIKKSTGQQTLAAAKTFMQNLAEDETSWPLLSFYANLFSYINETEYLLFNGTGTRGFSVRVNILGKGEISLCSIWSNKTIEFSLKR